MGFATCFFFTVAIGNVVWGVASDKFNRRPILILTYTTTLYFILLTAFTDTYAWLCFTVGLTGFFVGGVSPAGVTIVSELSPNHFRAKGLMLMFSLCVVGGLVSGLVILTSWMLSLLFILLIYTLLLFLFQCLPSSPRYLFIDGHPEEANELLIKMAIRNGTIEEVRELLPVIVPPNVRRGRMTDIFDREILPITVLLSLIWFGTFFNYHGTVELTAELPRREHGCIEASLDFLATFSILRSQPKISLSKAQR